MGDVSCFSQCDVRRDLALFDNADSLEWLVTVQAALTLIGNTTLAISAYFIWKIANTKPQS